MKQQPEYLLASQVADMIGMKWSRQRVHVELKRGTFPKPVTYVGKQPLWTPDQIQTYLGKGGSTSGGK